jgi:hypothetical protein
METFSDWGTQLHKMADFLQTDQSKFFTLLALEGERIGQMQRNITAMLREHDEGMKVLTKKQEDLFNDKKPDFEKWGNPDLMRMTDDDKLELLKDVRNKQLIDPEMQKILWKLRQTHAFMTETLNMEMAINQQWAVHDMRYNFSGLIKFMKDASMDQNKLWDDFETKIIQKMTTHT